MDDDAGLRRENGDLRVALTSAYSVADHLGQFVISAFETRQMGDDELAMTS